MELRTVKQSHHKMLQVIPLLQNHHRRYRERESGRLLLVFVFFFYLGEMSLRAAESTTK